MRALERPFEGADAFNLSGAVEPIESFVEALCDVVPAARELVTPRRPATARSRPTSTTAGLQASLGPIPTTPLREGIAETYRRFVALRDQGRLDLSDL